MAGLVAKRFGEAETSMPGGFTPPEQMKSSGPHGICPMGIARHGKAFRRQTRIFGTPEYREWRAYRQDFPSTQMVTKTIKKNTSKRPTRKLTWANMEKYMSVFQNADELLAQSEVVKTCSLEQPSPCKFVRDWFETQFPKYKEQPDFSPNAPKVIDLAAFQKKQEEKKEQGSNWKRRTLENDGI